MAKLVIGTNKQNGVPVISKATEKLPALGLMRAIDANGKLVNSKTESQLIDLTGVTDIADYMLAYAYSGNQNISGALDLSSLVNITGSNACAFAFYNCDYITSVDLSSLKTITSTNAVYNMFAYCDRITSVDLSSLETISSGVSSWFTGCVSLTSVNLSSLKSIIGNQACSNAFASCTSLRTLSFPAITTTTFGSRVNQFNGMLSGCSDITLHFPSNVQSVIEGLTGYSTTAPFGASSGTVLFDLPATE